MWILALMECGSQIEEARSSTILWRNQRTGNDIFASLTKLISNLLEREVKIVTSGRLGSVFYNSHKIILCFSNTFSLAFHFSSIIKNRITLFPFEKKYSFKFIILCKFKNFGNDHWSLFLITLFYINLYYA